MSYDLNQHPWGEGLEEKEIVKQYKDLFLDEAETRANQVCASLVRELSSGISDEDKKTISQIAGRHLMEGFIRVCKEVQGNSEKQNARYVGELTTQLHSTKREFKERSQEAERGIEVAAKEAERAKSNLSRKITELERKLREADDQLKQRESEWQKREEDTDTTYEQSINEERAEKEGIAKVLEQTRAEKAEALDRYKTALHNYDRQVKETEWYKTDYKKAKEEMQMIAATQEQTRQRCVNLEKELDDTKAKTRQLEAEREEPAKQFAKRESELRDEIEENNQMAGKLKSALKNQQKKFENKFKDTEVLVENAREQIRKLRTQTVRLTKRLSDNESISLEDSIGSGNRSRGPTKTDGPQRENEQLRAKLQEVERIFGTYIADIESRTDERNMHSEAIQEEIHHIRKRITSLTKTKEEYKSSLENEILKNEALELSLRDLKEGGTAADQVQKYAQDSATLRQEIADLSRENKELISKLEGKPGGDAEFNGEEYKADADRILRRALHQVDALEQRLVRIQVKMQADTEAYQVAGGVDHQRGRPDNLRPRPQQTEQALRENPRLTPALRQGLEDYQANYEALRELRQLGSQLLNYHDAVEKALTDYLNQFDSSSSSRAETAQRTELQVLQQFMDRIMDGIQQELTRCRADWNAGERSEALADKIVRFEAELERLRVGISFTQRNTKLRETLLQNRRHIGLIDDPEADVVVPAQQPGNVPPPGNPAQRDYAVAQIIIAIVLFLFVLDFFLES